MMKILIRRDIDQLCLSEDFRGLLDSTSFKVWTEMMLGMEQAFTNYEICCKNLRFLCFISSF